MGDVLKPNLPQWQRKEEPQVENDRVLYLAAELMHLFKENVDPTVTQLAAMRLVQKALTLMVAQAYGVETARRALNQASELAAQYSINGVDVEGDPV